MERVSSLTFVRPKLRALLAQEEIVEKSMTSLQKAAEGKGLRDGESQGQVTQDVARGSFHSIDEEHSVLMRVSTPLSLF